MPSYAPQWAPHASGTWPQPTIDEDGKLEEVKVELSCSLCGDRHQYTCTSGAPHQQIQRYALVHAHRDPMRAGPQR